jgi:hypothetical protein
MGDQTKQNPGKPMGDPKAPPPMPKQPNPSKPAPEGEKGQDFDIEKPEIDEDFGDDNVQKDDKGGL